VRLDPEESVLGPRLTDKQLRFVQEYLIDLNATQAAKRAGYSAKTAEQGGAQLLRNIKVAAAIKSAQGARAERTQITQDRVLKEYARIAFSNMKDFAEFGPEGVALKDLAAMDDDAARCVAEVSESTSKDGGSVRFKLHDKKGALDSIARHLGMFTDKTEHSGHLGVTHYKWMDPE
jgi:phage terminase small subunit